MKWYILAKTTNFKIAGTDVPQTENLPTDKPYSISIYGDYYRSPAPNDLFIPKFKLRYRAKLTDLTSAAIFGFPTQSIISENFLSVLKNFQSPPYQAFPTSVFDKKGIEHPYYVFMQNLPQFHLTDYTLSVFSRRHSELNYNYPPHQYEDFKAISFEDVVARKGFGASALYIKEDIEWDFFLLAAPPFLWMVNEKVADALRAANITGICLIPFQQGDDFVNDDIISKAQRVEGTKL